MKRAGKCELPKKKTRLKWKRQEKYETQKRCHMLFV